MLSVSSEMVYAQTQILTHGFGETAIVNSAGTDIFAYGVKPDCSM